ncbi:MAG: hypothetical protein ACXU8S_15060 [Phenylobacterium sp.]
MRFARWAFALAAIYGVIVLAPLLFAEGQIARTTGPVAYPEYYYGFAMLALTFQGVFWLISRDPMRYRALMPLTVIEKIPWGVTVWALHQQGRVHGAVLVFASIDICLGLLFTAAWLKTPRPQV